MYLGDTSPGDSVPPYDSNLLPNKMGLQAILWDSGGGNLGVTKAPTKFPHPLNSKGLHPPNSQPF